MAQLYAGTSGWAYPELEARFLSCQAAADKIPAALRHPTQHGRSEFHFPPAGERNHNPEMDRRNSAKVSASASRPIRSSRTSSASRTRRTSSRDFWPPSSRWPQPASWARYCFSSLPTSKPMPHCSKNFWQLCRAPCPPRSSFATIPGSATRFSSLLKKHNRALCVAETEERTTPDVVTAGFCYYRYRKPSYTPERAPRDGRANRRASRAGPRRVCLFQARRDSRRRAVRS